MGSPRILHIEHTCNFKHFRAIAVLTVVDEDMSRGVIVIADVEASPNDRR